VITNPRGVLLDPTEADYLVRALELLAELLRENRSTPTPRLDHLTRQMRRTVDSLASAQGNRKGGVTFELEAGQAAPYDLVDTSEAARILGITPAGVRYLADKGRLPAHRAGGRWLYPALAVVERAERQAARRAG